MEIQYIFGMIRLCRHSADVERSQVGRRCEWVDYAEPMRIFEFGPDRGRHIEQYGSDFVISRLAHLEGLHVACMHLGPGRLVGYHPASSYQLFIVVQGEGWVQSEDRKQVRIRAGEAAVWEPGEHHGAGTDAGLTAIVIEGDILVADPEGIGPIPQGER